MPSVKPLQDCPGFKCKSGISKCLPLKRKCDKTVDCLNAEDEIGCDFTNLRSVNEMFPKIHKTDDNKSSEKRESIFSPISLTSETIPPVFKTTIEPIDPNTFTTSTEISNITNSEHENLPTKGTVEDKTPDFVHASTIEVSPSSSSESDSDSTENITEDAMTIKNVVDSERGDSEIFTVTFVPEKLEAKSSVIEKPDDQRRTDIIIEDEITSTISTPSEMLENQSQPTFITVKPDFEKPLLDDKDLVNLDNTVLKVDKELDIVMNNSEKLIVDLLPKLETINQTTFIENKSQEQEPSKTSNDELSAKNLPVNENLSSFFNKIDDIDLTELKPASIRRKHLVPKDFECKR